MYFQGRGDSSNNFPSSILKKCKFSFLFGKNIIANGLSQGILDILYPRLLKYPLFPSNSAEEAPLQFINVQKITGQLLI